ncbi:MAG: chemotaxis protein CheW [Magnetococcales bacterium]|nr:chemotaxis protein CheW [Magnetococcales bacterium]
MEKILIFSLDGRQYGIGVREVERVIRAVAIRPVPEGPREMLGLIDMAGRLLPVLEVRSRLGHPVRNLGLDDRIILLAGHHLVGVVVDGIVGVDSMEALELRQPEDLYPGLDRSLAGVGRHLGEMVLVLDVSRLFGQQLLAAWHELALHHDRGRVD